MRFLIASLLLLTACPSDRGDDEPGPDAGTEPVLDPDWLPGVQASALATDATHLYLGGATLDRVSLDGGEPETLYTIPAPSSQAFAMIDTIVVGPTDVVFVQRIIDAATQGYDLTLFAVAKTGGAVRTLATSRDQRAFLGVTIDGANVIYSSFTAIYRVPLAGGMQPKFIAESPESIRYWIFSPTVVGENLVWAEDASLYTIPKASTGDGTLLSPLPGVGRIIGGDATALVVALSSSIANQTGAESFVEIDPTTGAAGSVVQIGREANQAIATDTDVWAATFDGIVRIPRDGGAAEIVMTEPTLVITASDDALFTSTEAGIARITRR